MTVIESKLLKTPLCLQSKDRTGFLYGLWIQKTLFTYTVRLRRISKAVSNPAADTNRITKTI